jgi:inorganic triphosphatase YgiF
MTKLNNGKIYHSARFYLKNRAVSVIMWLAMEIELKYNIENNEQMDKIWSDAHLASIEERDSRGVIPMKAAYFDTPEFDLSQNGLAFRIRREGDRCVGTLKLRDNAGDEGGLDVSELEESGRDISGLYARDEINVPIKDETCFLNPDPTVFKESDQGKILLDVIGDKQIICVFETIFTRKKFRIDSNDTICEISIDEGKIISGDRSLPIHELEVELFSGSLDELLRIGEDIASRYNLEPEELSKYARGKMLLTGEL